VSPDDDRDVPVPLSFVKNESPVHGWNPSHLEAKRVQSRVERHCRRADGSYRASINRERNVYWSAPRRILYVENHRGNRSLHILELRSTVLTQEVRTACGEAEPEHLARLSQLACPTKLLDAFIRGDAFILGRVGRG
jgi:hypothetical protein